MPRSDLVTKAAAEAGTDAGAWAWSPERVAQAIAALGGGGAGDVTAAATLVADEIVQGDAAAKGVKTTGAALSSLATVFITSAGNAGSGTISGQTYQAATNPANKVMTAFESDDDTVTVTAEIHLFGSTWTPANAVLKNNGTVVDTVAALYWTQIDDRVYTVQFAHSAASASGTYTVETSDGYASATCAYTRGLDAPLVLSLIFVNQGTNADPYPGIQTQFAASQTMYFSGTTEPHADEVYIVDYQATNGRGLQGPFTVTAGAFSGTLPAGDGNTAARKLQAYAKVTGGANGPSFTSTATVDLDQTVPTFSSATHSYPAGQEALKNSETDTVTITHTNAAAGDTYLYDTGGTSELSIPSTTTYASSKVVTRIAGSYRESGTNYRCQATRTQKNGLAATKSTTVKIAHTAPVVTVTGATTRLGSGGGTSDHTITLTSSQANLSTSTPSLATGAGDTSTWQGSWASSGATAYTRALRVADTDIKPGGQTANDYSWGACSVKNRAGLEATTVSTNPTYSLGGFSTRTINMGPITGGDPPYTHTGDIGVPVVNPAKTNVVNTSKSSIVQAYEGNVLHHNNSDSSLNNYWTTVAALGSDAFDDYTQYFHCSDSKFYNSVTAPGGFNVTISEAA